MFALKVVQLYFFETLNNRPIVIEKEGMEIRKV